MTALLAIDPIWYYVAAYVGGAIVLSIIVAKYLNRDSD